MNFLSHKNGRIFLYETRNPNFHVKDVQFGAETAYRDGLLTIDKEAAIAYLRGIEAATGLTCTGIVNNTHLCGETTAEEIRKGAALAADVSRRTGIPVLCHVAVERLVPQVEDLPEAVFPITIQMKKPWE